MVVEKGYKLTEVGVIPEDWDEMRLNEIVNLMTNGFVGTAKIHYTDLSNGVLYIQGYNVMENAFNLHGIKYVTTDFHFKNQKSCLRQGDLLTVQTGDVGLTTIVPYELEGSNCHALIITRFKKSHVYSKFVSFYFNSKQGRSRLKLIETGTTMKHLNVGNMLHFKIPLPPLHEQTAIANALSDMDALIAQTEKLIEKKKAIKQGVMQELLKPKEGWVTKKLGENTSILRGGSPRPIEDFLTTTSDGINWIKIGDVGKTAKYITSTDEKITPAGMSRSRVVNPGDFLLSNSMSFGRPYIMQICGCIHDGWLVITEYESNFDRDFLYYVLGSEAIFTQYKSMASGSSVLNLSKEIVKEVKVICPKYLDEQKQIARILSDIDIDIDFTETKLQKLKNQKQGMMQALLTGKIRLV
jgi:type I restriction enzyme S subunit